MFHLTMHSKHFIWCRNIRQRTTQTESVREPAVTTTWAILSDTAQVSVLTCTFRASCCSARLSWAQVLDFAGSSVWDRLSD